jgi:hypothetical protein
MSELCVSSTAWCNGLECQQCQALFNLAVVAPALKAAGIERERGLVFVQAMHTNWKQLVTARLTAIRQQQAQQAQAAQIAASQAPATAAPASSAQGSGHVQVGPIPVPVPFPHEVVSTEHAQVPTTRSDGPRSISQSGSVRRLRDNKKARSSENRETEHHQSERGESNGSVKTHDSSSSLSKEKTEP